MLNITDRATEDAIPPFLRLGFRPFFLLGCLYGIWVLLRWILILSGGWTWHNLYSSLAWHSHELQFGFAMAIVLGFLLTAAQNWTGRRGLHGTPLAILVGLWLAARIAMNLPLNGLVFSAICDSAALLMAIITLARMVLPTKNYRNLAFVPVLLIFLLLHMSQMYALIENNAELSHRLGFATIWWLAILVSMMGARVIPFFIERRLESPIARERIPVTLVTQGLLALIFIFTLVNQQQFMWPLIALSLIFQGLRLMRWYRNGLWQEPLLWSLWISYAFLPLGLALLLLLPSQASAAMHLLTVGFVSSMILAMISRVSLGHTSRPLKAHPLIVVALAMMPIAALSRGLLTVLVPEITYALLVISALCWLGALGSYVVIYAPMLLTRRPDGHSG